MKQWPLFLILLLLLPGAAGACFGPKLHVGIGADPASQVLAEVVILYVKEKTGIETERVALGAREGEAELAADQIDLAISSGLKGADRLFATGAGPSVAVGPRPRQDLQFTTVMPALEKLAGLFGSADLAGLQAAVAAGEPAAAAARRFLQERRWI
ncbi:hypothetical protein JCM30471_09270 [Desulfuromonas carbonis]|uniref:hypothetical protein n=1 Tax=Desulfuromonas sp. DDH964 TaxID=1823759 RepID=UPI00078BE114|nr:hypothetical protein [Desulfuromonas sp. DDH964]AMV72410.1 lipoprotein [Desulfuromonas sp. DDH964]